MRRTLRISALLSSSGSESSGFKVNLVEILH